MYVLLEFWQKIMAIPIMNPLLWFMIMKYRLSETAQHTLTTIVVRVTEDGGTVLAGISILTLTTCMVHLITSNFLACGLPSGGLK